jgi:hypothetical protein
LLALLRRKLHEIMDSTAGMLECEQDAGLTNLGQKLTCTTGC